MMVGVLVGGITKTLNKEIIMDYNYALMGCDCVDDNHVADPNCTLCYGTGTYDAEAAFWALAEAEGKVTYE